MSKIQKPKKMNSEAEVWIKTFAERYIRQEVSVRFIHEAGKRPGQLFGRICHQTEKLFDDRLKREPPIFPQSGLFLWLTMSGFERRDWSRESLEMLSQEMSYGGLIIAHYGKWFWARSEPGKHIPGVDYHGLDESSLKKS